MKNWRAIPVVLVLVAGAAACGDDDGGDDESGLSDLTTTSVADTDETTTTLSNDESDDTTTTTTDDGDVDVPDGWSVVDHSEFTIALPEGWEEANELVDDPEFAEYMDEALGGEANLEQMLAQLDLMAVNTETVASGFATNLNVIVNRASPADTVELLEDQIGPALQAQMGAVVTSTERVTLNGEDALRVEYDYDSQGVSLRGLQFYVLGENLSGVITFTAATDAVDYDTWGEVAETFTLAS